MTKKVNLEYRGDGPVQLVHFLFEQTEISKMKIKHALACGACVVKQKGRKAFKKVRKAKADLKPGDRIQFFYDEKILGLPVPEGIECLYDDKDFGIWFKPVGALSQGNQYSDHTSILRFVEKEKKQAYLVHRLDRETAGLMIIAYNGKMAADISKLLQEHKVNKYYLAWVKGEMDLEHQIDKAIDIDLDDKHAKTLYTCLKSESRRSLCDIQILTGRMHQIRRHFEAIEFPVLGDPKYGENNKNKDGLQLLSYRLSFKHPKTSKIIDICHDKEMESFKNK
jgi:tRNA pseudouridine32 synthase/23S rRNA pseudouridine746 synthase